MNILCNPGHIVVYLDENGYEHDKEEARKFLQKGKAYEVNRIEVSSFHTDVYLAGIEGGPFNSVMFEDA